MAVPEHYEEHATRIEQAAKEGTLDYEAAAISGVVRSWRQTDPVCQSLALADAQVWATLHLARVSKEHLDGC